MKVAGWAKLLILMSSILAGIVLLFFIGVKSINFIIPKLPSTLGKQIENIVINQYTPQEYDSKKSETVNEYLYQLTGTKDYKGFVVNSTEVNALALPGNVIIVYSKLFDTYPKDELQFVLAHELGHFNNKDHLKNLGRLFLGVAFRNFVDIDYVAPILSGVYDQISLSFSREDELKADYFAIELLKKKGLNVKSSLSFMKKIESVDGNSKFNYFSTHPNPKDRIAQIETYLATVK